MCSESRLSSRQMREIYQARWGVEIYYRDFKQTFGRGKLLSKTADNAQLELDWSIARPLGDLPVRHSPTHRQRRPAQAAERGQSVARVSPADGASQVRPGPRGGPFQPRGGRRQRQLTAQNLQSEPKPSPQKAETQHRPTDHPDCHEGTTNRGRKPKNRCIIQGERRRVAPRRRSHRVGRHPPADHGRLEFLHVVFVD